VERWQRIGFGGRERMLEYLSDMEIYRRVICTLVPAARRYVWLATADLKDLYVEHNGRMVPFLAVLSELVRRKVEVRLLHAKEPGAAFRRDFDRYPNLLGGLERMLCPRVHLKCAVVDGRVVYVGSANLTGAGVGAKSQRRRNFEGGIVTDEKRIVDAVVEQFDMIWRGGYCKDCQRKQYCADYKDILGQ